MPGSGRPGRWLLRPPSAHSRARLFCFPYSGVGASMYWRWPAFVGFVEICRVQLPGRENRIREPHYGTYEQLAEETVDGLRPYLDRPYGFFGHCGGALSAFATALQLARAELPPPVAVFVSSQVAPHDGPYGRFLTLSDDELRVELDVFSRAMGGEPQPDALDLGLEVLRADVTANQKYRLELPEPLSSDLYAIGWSRDVEIRPDQMGGWREYAPVDRYFPVVLDGEHHTFLDAPQSLCDVFRRGFAEVTA